VTPPAAGRLALGPLDFLPSALREPRRPGRAIIVGWLLSLVGSLVLAALVRLVAPDLEGPQFPALDPAMMLFLLVVFAPVVETLIMAAALELLLRLRLPPAAAILLSTVGWALGHSSQAPAWGLAIWWPFLIFSTLFVVWRQRSYSAALGVPLAAHALQNLLPGLMVAFAPAG
jgi:membrane protease YdiL (CAAX protease family)